MDFPINPVSSQQESLNVDFTDVPTGGKYSGLNTGDKAHAKCTNVTVKNGDDGTVTYIFEFLGTEGAATGLTFTRNCTFPDFAAMMLTTAEALGVTKVKVFDAAGNPVMYKDAKGNERQKETLPLENCKGKLALLEFKRSTSPKNGKSYLNIAKVLAPTQAAPSGPTIL
jgi:hypothetical protein